MSLTVSSTAFQDGQPIPRKYTADDANVSPPLKWTEPPTGTRCWALLCEDPDAPRGIWTHWVLFNLAPEAQGLHEGIPTEEELPNEASQGTNDFGKVGYNGPAPPPGKPHRYFFKLFALDTSLDLGSDVKRAQLLDAMKGHILAEGQLMGTYGRSK